MNTEKRITPIIVCFFLGLLALIVGVSSLAKRSSYLPVEATIIRIEESYDAAEERYNYKTIAKYQVNGIEYEGDIGYYAPQFKEGKVIEIRYDPNDPVNVEAASPGALIYFVGIGAILIAAGVYLLIPRKELSSCS